MDELEVFEKHELNPWWWALVLVFPVLSTLLTHWLAYK